MSAKRLIRTSAICLVAIAGMAACAGSQGGDSEPGAVVIRREPMRLIAPDDYRLPLQLEPVKQLVLAAPCDGTPIRPNPGAVAAAKAAAATSETATTPVKSADKPISEKKKTTSGF
jgi:hypothetical protein